MLSIIYNVSRSSSERDWREQVLEVLKKNIKSPYDQWISEFIDFLDKLYVKWNNAERNVKEKYAYHMALLMADSDRTNVIRAKLNSYYAYLVYKGYASAYKLMKNKVVAGGESIYTWLRMYREVMG